MSSFYRFILAALAATFALVSTPVSAKPFDKPYLAQEAARYQRDIVRNTATGDRPAEDWIKDGIAAVKKDDWRAAYAAFGTAIAAKPDSEQAWRNYAIALLKMEAKDSETYDFPPKAKAAAYRAY